MSPLRIAIALLLVLLAAGRAAAQVGMGSVRGRVVAASDGAVVSYALVRLASAEGGAPARSALTDAEGAFSFAAVVPGTYRLSLERVGYSSEATDAFAVAAEQTVERVIRSAPRAVAIRPIVATAECRTAENLERYPDLAALWNEAVKGMEARRAFDATYHYEFDQRQYATMTRRNGGALDSTVEHVVRDPRNPVNRNRSGWGTVRRDRMRLEIPDGTEILDPLFLSTHCLDSGMDEEAGVYTIGFRPRRSERGRIDIRGEMRLDRATLQVKSLQVEWTDATRVFLEATVEFTEAVVPGGAVRLPVGAIFSGSPPESMRVGEMRGQIMFVNYTNLYRVAQP
ncbi:MAG TPA: carboxypeptidase-like regulatory domain-containing protein [Longimicrobium sp.]